MSDIEYQFQYQLRGDGPFQWSFALQCIIDHTNGKHAVYEVTNRDWRRVGPEFKTRDEGSKYLGFTPGRKDVEENWKRLKEEYHNLYADEIETRQRFHGENRPNFGRPSQGYTERMQFSGTPALKAWIEGQASGKETFSETTRRLLEELKAQKAPEA